MKTHDTIGRRTRFLRQPVGKRVRPTGRDLAWFEELHRHGPLSSTYLRAFSPGNDRADLRRLTDLYHEADTPHGGAYLERPAQQTRTLDPRANDLVYELTPASERLLQEHGLWSDQAPAPNGAWLHRYMTASITASIALTAKREGVGFIGQAEILGRAGVANRFAIPDLPDLIPDALFGLDFGGNYLFFAVEADRATEQAGDVKAHRKTYERTIRQYREFVGRGLYRQALGLTAGMLVLNVATAPGRMRNLLELTADIAEKGYNNFMLFQCVGAFATIFRPPKVLDQLYRGPWARAGLAPFCISKI
ncbi:conserved hypothetical protein [uncultured Defluviicoccus sp.]|uniref:Uncharacterized protein n=1 Tax=metagenome TaxID=256318 RepID=A0A380TKX8_9ZZZZ|nr:conserved hypothetical protein [uncultured Defluviicoccus sp.]